MLPPRSGLLSHPMTDAEIEELLAELRRLRKLDQVPDGAGAATVASCAITSGARIRRWFSSKSSAAVAQASTAPSGASSR